MKKTTAIILILFFASIALQAQQAVQYDQFTFNDYGFNPAIAGSANGFMFLAGRRTQWRGFEGAPETNFANVTKAFGKKGYKHHWHGVGAYVEQDKMGVFTTQVIYLSYAIHMKVSPKYRLSFGVAGGMKSVALSNAVFNNSDPTFLEENRKVKVPDIIPGMYLYSKKFTLSIALHNLYKNTLSFGGKTLGSGNGVELLPTSYISISRKFVTGSYDFINVPAINIQSNFRGFPSINLNFMSYYKKRVGLGMNYRIHDAITAIIQVRIWKNLVVGFAYDYTISRFRAAKANSEEFMLGFSPMMSTEDLQKLGTADCPKFELK